MRIIYSFLGYKWFFVAKFNILRTYFIYYQQFILNDIEQHLIYYSSDYFSLSNQKMNSNNSYILLCLKLFCRATFKKTKSNEKRKSDGLFSKFIMSLIQLIVNLGCILNYLRKLETISIDRSNNGALSVPLEYGSNAKELKVVSHYFLPSTFDKVSLLTFLQVLYSPRFYIIFKIFCNKDIVCTTHCAARSVGCTWRCAVVKHAFTNSNMLTEFFLSPLRRR